MTDRNEVMWCVDCGGRFTQEEIEGWGCPECGSQSVPCDTKKDVTVEINWHELRILVIWAENWVQQHARKKTDDSSEKMPVTVTAIARRLQGQHPSLGHLTLSGEMAALPADLAKSGIHVGVVETVGIEKPRLLEVNGPGAVGHTKARREFSLSGTGFTLKECGCSIGLCDGSGVKDGTCRVSPPPSPISSRDQ